MRPYVLLTALALGWLGSSLSLAKESVVPRLAANNTLGLMKVAGQQVIVHGKVNKATISKSGHHFLNFASSSFSVVCFKSEVSQFEGVGPAKLWGNKEIEVSGKLEVYRGKPQIKLTSSDQVRLVKNSDPAPRTEKKTFSLQDVRVDFGPPGASKSTLDVSDPGERKSDSPTDASSFRLQQTGKLTWTSPAGLVYRGKDAQGLTRVEHVLRHAADQPDRRGSHGVFDGGNDQALATVDEAWKIAQAKNVKPKREGDRLAYTIPMGRRVGYLGGTSGARRNHPALKNVFIVIRGRSEVVTAFPR